MMQGSEHSIGLCLVLHLSSAVLDQHQLPRSGTSTSTSSSSHTGTGTDVASTREPAPAMTVDLEPSKIHYDSFVRGQTDAPLRTRSSIARDTAQDIYKTTGMESGR